MKKIATLLLFFSVLLNGISTIAANGEGTLIGAFFVSSGFKADFSTNTNKNYEIKIENPTDTLEIRVKNGLVFVDGKTTASAVCKMNSQWYITGNNDLYNVVLDGISIDCGTIDISSGETQLFVTGCDTVLRAFSEANTDTEVRVSSEYLTIENDYITGLEYNMTAQQVISLVDVTSDATATVYTENGFVRTGILRSGDRLCVTDKYGNVVFTYSFPDMELNYLTSDIFDVNTSDMMIDGVCANLTEEQIIGTLKANTSFTAQIKDKNTLTITIAGKEYNFTLLNTQPNEAMLFHENFEEGEHSNWQCVNGSMNEIYTDKLHKNAIAFYPNYSSYATLKRRITPINDICVFSHSVKYVYPENHTRHFHTPFLKSSSGKTIEIRERRGDIVYNDVSFSEKENKEVSMDIIKNIKSESGQWYDMKIIFKPKEHIYNFYVDNTFVGTGNTYNEMNDISEIDYNLYSVNDTKEEGEMYIDDVAIFTPYVQLAAIEFYNGNTSVYSSQNIESCDKIKLIFANEEYNTINADTINEAISLTDNFGKEINFQSEITGNEVMLNLNSPIITGEYTLNLINPKTIYNETTQISRVYNFTVGTPNEGIEYAEVETDGVKARAEVGFYAQDTSTTLILATYNFDGSLCGVKAKEVSNATETIECTANTEVFKAKLFLWDSMQGIVPIGEEFNKVFIE